MRGMEVFTDHYRLLARYNPRFNTNLLDAAERLTDAERTLWCQSPKWKKPLPAWPLGVTKVEGGGVQADGS